MTVLHPGNPDEHRERGRWVLREGQREAGGYEREREREREGGYRERERETDGMRAELL